MLSFKITNLLTFVTHLLCIILLLLKWHTYIHNRLWLLLYHVNKRLPTICSLCFKISPPKVYLNGSLMINSSRFLAVLFVLIWESKIGYLAHVVANAIGHGYAKKGDDGSPIMVAALAYYKQYFYESLHSSSINRPNIA